MIISPEAILEQDPSTFSQREAVENAWADAMRTLRGALEDSSVLDVGVLVGAPGSGKSTWAKNKDADRVVLFDAVWSNVGRRAAVARRIRRAGKNAVCVWFRTPLRISIERNSRRPAWRRVPEAVLKRSAMQIKNSPPTKAEGWDAILTVRRA